MNLSNLISNVTGKTLSYTSQMSPSPNEICFVDCTFDGKKYDVISFCEDGVIRLYKKHPSDKPTHTLKFFCA